MTRTLICQDSSVCHPRRRNCPIDAMLFLEFEFTLKRDCLPYATFSMVSELHDLRQPTGEGILLNLVTLVNNFQFMVNMWNTCPPKLKFLPSFGPISAPFRSGFGPIIGIIGS